MIKTCGIYHLHLLVKDLERSIRFYQDVFGMQVRYRVGSTMAFLNTPGSQDVLTLNQASESEEKSDIGNNAGVHHFGFGLDEGVSLDQAVEEVVRAGGTLERRGEHAPGHRFAYCRDPDGYLFEL